MGLASNERVHYNKQQLYITQTSDTLIGRQQQHSRTVETIFVCISLLLSRLSMLPSLSEQNWLGNLGNLGSNKI